jgi:uncharacterized GH25 family protein
MSSILIPALASAHDIWIVPKTTGKAYEMVFGHPGALEPYDPVRIEELIATDTSGNPQDIHTVVHDSKVEIQAITNTALVSLVYDNGFSTLGPDRKSSTNPKWKIPKYKVSSQMKMINKNLLIWNEALTRPIGLKLEIIPLADPLNLKPGETFPIQVIYKSKPLPKADVEVMGDMNLYTTDALGKVKVPIQKTDFQYIYVSYIEPAKSNPNVDEVELSSNLIFIPQR